MKRRDSLFDSYRKEDFIPEQPSDLSEKRKEAMKTYPPTYTPFQFEYRFKPNDVLTVYNELRNWLETNGIPVVEKGNRQYIVGDRSEELYLLFKTKTDGENILRVFGSPLSFNKYPDLIDALTSPDSPVEYKESEVISVMGSVRETPFPWRFEFIYDPDESFDRSNEEYRSILQWIVDQEIVRFVDEHKFKEPGDEHPTFIRIKETSEGKPILMLEGYSIDEGEILDRLRDKESPFNFRKSYVVGRKSGNDSKAGYSEAIRRNQSQSDCNPHASSSSPIISNEAKKDVYQVWVEKQRTFWGYENE